MPHQLGKEQSRDLGRGQGRRQQDRNSIILITFLMPEGCHDMCRQAATTSYACRKRAWRLPGAGSRLCILVLHSDSLIENKLISISISGSEPICMLPLPRTAFTCHFPPYARPHAGHAPELRPIPHFQSCPTGTSDSAELRMYTV